MDSFLEVPRAIPWYAWVAIVAIVIEGIKSIVAATHRHGQRMAMIRQGLDPDRRREDREA